MDKLIDLINQGGTGEYDARQPQERGEAVALHREAVRVAAVAAIRAATGCPDLIGNDGKALSEGLMDELDGMFYAHPPADAQRVAELEAQLDDLRIAAKYSEEVEATPENRLETILYDTLLERDELKRQLTASLEREGRMWEALQGLYDLVMHPSLDADETVPQIVKAKAALAAEKGEK